MKESLEIRLKDEKDPTLWERLMQWLGGGQGHASRPLQQVPKIGTHTEILLYQTQKIKLKDAVESPGERPSDTGFTRKPDDQESQLII